MRTIYLFFSLLLSLTAFGQPSPINRRAFALAGLAQASPSPILFSLEHWWVSSDMPTGAVTSAGWTDRIDHAYIFVTNNFFGNVAPITNSTNGLIFTGTTFPIMSNHTITFFPQGTGITNRSLFLIYSTTISTKEAIFTREYPNGFSEGFYFNYNPTNDTSVAGRWGLYPHAERLGGDLLKTDGTIQDVGAIQTAQGNPAPIDGYTNGFYSASSVQGNYDLSCLGNGGPGNFVGNLLEILVYTNRGDSTLASNVHYYRTNLYGGSP